MAHVTKHSADDSGEGSADKRVRQKPARRARLSNIIDSMVLVDMALYSAIPRAIYPNSRFGTGIALILLRDVLFLMQMIMLLLISRDFSSLQPVISVIVIILIALFAMEAIYLTKFKQFVEIMRSDVTTEDEQLYRAVAARVRETYRIENKDAG